ncbi:hypothetical protein BWQ93_08085 [Sphingopyxis sp. QXT-31]|uniref:DUF3800 domain-containing protein n=1 Tax=Sphingopyxis sp. QXT-31 TaxID=1357916 RepID=UPI000979302B|nr:DUF3800 domain-containing protein [Sphingopyxis sp. QXT-31]APZ98454.1 hypothetical protein BWQ93_08085 [Sphingopyxis sp. QXT-31]
MEVGFRKSFYGDDEVIAFFDESGDETLKDPGNPTFVLGCCMVRGRDLPALRQAWLDVREQVTGHRDRQMHMRNMRLGRKRDYPVRRFFEQETFYRAGVAITDQTIFEMGEFPHKPVFGIALNLVGQLMAAVMGGRPSHGLCLIIEDNARLRPSYEAQLSTQRLSMDGISMPVSWALLDKTAEEPGLEIADFIAHSIAGFIRTERSAATKFAPRFGSIFPDLPHAKFWELNTCRFDGMRPTRQME